MGLAWRTGRVHSRLRRYSFSNVVRRCERSEPMADDQYDHAIDYLMRHPEEILEAWRNCLTHPAGCLFRFAHTAMCGSAWQSCTHGCLTMIRSNTFYKHDAPTPVLTDAIRADTRIPCSASDIRLHHLPAFAEWQRRLDREVTP
jgi:hypothetical protein